MTTDPFKNIKDAWDWFQIQNLISRNYDRIPAIGIGPTLANPLLERALVGLLTINLSSILDEALDVYISNHKIPLKHDKLYSRIEALSSAGVIKNAADLHSLRGARNDHAHTPASFASSTQLDWEKLDLGIKDVATVLRDDLRMLDPPIKYEWFFERNPIFHDGGDVAVTQRYRFGVKRDGEEAFVSAQTLDFMRLSASDRDKPTL